MSQHKAKRAKTKAPAAALPPIYEELAALHSATLTAVAFLAPKGVLCSLPVLQQSVAALTTHALGVEQLQRMVALDASLGLRHAWIAPAPGAPPEEVDPATRPLDAEEAALYEAALESGGDPGEVLASNTGANLHITRGDLACMRPPQWLNDEAVNFYMATLNDRDARDRAGPGRLPRCHFFNTFF